MKTVKAIISGVDLSDVMIIGGLGVASWGFYEFQPWVAKAVSGCLLIVIGWARGR